jgi:hypothetical protein
MVIPTWQLKIVVTPVISVANHLLSADTYFKNFSHTMHPADNLQVNISYDNNTIDSLHFLNNQIQERTFTLTDDHEIVDHTIIFNLSGKNNSHSCHTDTNETVSWLLKFDLYIENFCISGVFLENNNTDEFFSDFYVGENGTRILKIKTPIYRWLLQHEDNILRSMHNLNNSAL